MRAISSSSCSMAPWWGSCLYPTLITLISVWMFLAHDAMLVLCSNISSSSPSLSPTPLHHSQGSDRWERDPQVLAARHPGGDPALPHPYNYCSVFWMFLAHDAMLVLCYNISSSLSSPPPLFTTLRGLTDESEILKFLQHGTLVGLLPVPHPILIRKYQANSGTTLWFRTYMWGVIYLRYLLVFILSIVTKFAAQSMLMK